MHPSENKHQQYETYSNHARLLHEFITQVFNEEILTVVSVVLSGHSQHRVEN